MILFSLSLFLPSISQLLKYLGPLGLSVFAFSLLPAVWLLDRFVYKKRLSDLSPHAAYGWAAGFVLLFLTLMLYFYAPIHARPEGSDRLEGLNLAALQISKGESPYAVRSSLGNPINNFPGEILLAWPFYRLFGNTGFAVFFWMAAYFLVLCALVSPPRALWLLWVVFCLCPEALREVLTGGVLTANAFFVFFFFWRASVAVQTQRFWPQGVLWCLLLGVALSSKSSFWLVAPSLFIFLGKNTDWKKAAAAAVSTMLGFLAVTGPFYLHNPAGFTPLSANNVFLGFQAWLPQASWLFPAFAVIFSVLAAIFPAPPSQKNLFARAAAALLFPVLLFTLVPGLARGEWIHEFGYALPFLFFVLPVFFMKDGGCCQANAAASSSAATACASGVQCGSLGK